jgi:uncharacterized protein (DUF1015 family)
MADIVPFAGLRYDSSRVGDLSRVLSPPYDAIAEAERDELEARHPANVVRVELPRGDADRRYEAAATWLRAWTADGVLRVDPTPAFYLYEQEFESMGRRSVQRGFLAAVRLEPFERRIVLPHERTLSGPKEDRRKLILATRTQTSPLFGLYRDPDARAAAVLDAAFEAPALVDTATPDGHRHRLWRLEDRAAIGRLQRILRDKQIVIADGHHRYETLLTLGPELRALDFAAGEAAADFGMMFLVRAEEPGLRVSPTHRLVRGLEDFRFADLRAAAAPAFEIADGPEATPRAIEDRLRREGAAGVVFAARVSGQSATTWFTLKRIVDLSALGPPELRKLDVTVLHGVILASLLAIDDAAVDRQANLAYTHDTALALDRVDSGEAQVAFLMNPTKIADLLAACEAGQLLPQKSTYFQPKPATGLVMYPLDGRASR